MAGHTRSIDKFETYPETAAIRVAHAAGPAGEDNLEVSWMNFFSNTDIPQADIDAYRAAMLDLNKRA